MISDRVRWNEKYRRKGYPEDPSAIVKSFSGMVEPTTALDIAAGNGRNAFYLAGQGFTVDAVDISDEGLSLRRGRHPAVRSICADLDTFDIPVERYGLIINILFLNRRLFPQIREGLSPGGLLIFETLLEAPGRAEYPARGRDYFLRENELLHSFLALRILHYHEERDSSQESGRRLASLVAMKQK